MLSESGNYIRPIARAFFAGTYVGEEVADSCWFFNLPGVPAVWASALLETPQLRHTAARELACIGRAFLARNFGGRTEAPAWALHGFETFAYHLVVETLRRDASRVKDVFDLACAFKDCIVVPQESHTKSFCVTMENIPNSCVYFAREAWSLEEWEVALGEELAARVSDDAAARMHVAVSGPICEFFKRVGYHVDKSASPSLVLVRQLALQMAQMARSSRIAKDSKFVTKWKNLRLQRDRLERSCYAPSRGIQKRDGRM